MKTPYPPKPDEHRFEKPVAWLLGRELIASLKWTILYGLFKGKLDPRDWMQAEPIRVEARSDDGEFWFDYIADTGDGQKATYSMAYLSLSDLWVEPSTSEASAVALDASPDKSLRLPRGEFLFVGGDTSYHIADYATLANRFQNPFRWAYEDLEREGKMADQARRPLFAIPGNHDYYDALDGFNRQFRRPTTGEDTPNQDGELPLLSMPGFKRCQEASFVALELPFNWWLWGMDTEDGIIDFRQLEFFRKLNKEREIRKLIIATPQPATVMGKYAGADSNISKMFESLGLERPFLRGAGGLAKDKCRLDISGDTHHYARYWGSRSKGANSSAPSAGNYASVVSGLGGAFLHASHTDMNEIEEQQLYPKKGASRKEFAKEIFNPWNIWDGGYVWLMGFIIAAVISFAATVAPSSKEAVSNVLSWPALGLTAEQLEPVRVEVDRRGADYFLQGMPRGASSAALRIALVALSLIAIIGGVVYSRYLLGQLEKRRLARRVTITLRDRAVVFLAMLIAAGSLAAWVIDFYQRRVQLAQFGSSLLVLVSLIWALLAVVESVLYSAYLVRQTYDHTINWWDYWPAWALLALGAASVIAGIMIFGQYPAAHLLSDLVFAVIVFGLPPSLVLLATVVGGALHNGASRAAFGLLGAWHAVLQLTVPFLLVFFGSWWMLAVAVALLVAFRRLGRWLFARDSRALLVAA